MTKTRDRLKQPLVAIVGPTAVGKTDLVLQIAAQLDAEIVNMDSMQIYRFMDIGTAKPSQKEQKMVRHHLLDLVNPDDEYNVSRFIDDAARVCSDLEARHKLPIMTGGTGLYLKGFQEGVFAIGGAGASDDRQDATKVRDRLATELAEKGRAHLFEKLKNFDSVSAARIHPNDTSRLLRALQIYEQTGVPWSVHLARQQEVLGGEGSRRREILKIGLTCDRELLYERINRRTEKMFEIGLLAEVENLVNMGYLPDLKSMQAIGYRHALKVLSGEWSKDEAVMIMARDTRRYAKRQYTWFKKDQQISWFESGQGTEISHLINAYLNGAR